MKTENLWLHVVILSGPAFLLLFAAFASVALGYRLIFVGIAFVILGPYMSIRVKHPMLTTIFAGAGLASTIIGFALTVASW